MALDDSSKLAQALADPAISSALVVGHPGHEIRVFEWLGRSRPALYTLTSGTRDGNRSRIAASQAIAADAGATPVTGWGGMADGALYRAVLSGEADRFVHPTMALARSLVAREVALVVTDGWQLYNVAHDLAHVMARIAADLAAQALAREIAVVTYPVVPHGGVPRAPRGAELLVRRLPAEDVAAKQAALAGMPQLAGEVADLVAVEGEAALGVERFERPPPLAALLQAPGLKPHYEEYGESRVSAGTYGEVIRWSHVAPIMQAIAALA